MAIISPGRSHRSQALAVHPAITRRAAVLGHRMVLDEAQVSSSNLLWLGSDKRLAILMEEADGSLQGYYLAPVAGSARTYRTLDLVEPALVARTMALMRQVR